MLFRKSLEEAFFFLQLSAELLSQKMKENAVFGRMTNGCDLTLIGGKKSAAATSSFSAIMSNWKKKYSDVRIIDQSPAGLIEKVSNNLLKLIDD